MRNKRLNKPGRRIDMFKHDPIEDDLDIKPVLAVATEEARAELIAAGKNIGFSSCRSLWRVKQRILKEKYQVEWKSPGEMNPGCDFD